LRVFFSSLSSFNSLSPPDGKGVVFMREDDLSDLYQPIRLMHGVTRQRVDELTS